MSDLISRQAAIDALCSVCGVDCDKSKFVYDGKQEDQVILCPEHYALTQLPSAQPEQRWIPCEERLPEDYTDVLVWFEYFRYGDYNCLYQTYGIGDYIANYGWMVDNDKGWHKLRVIAWMPLPEPYKTESEDKE